MLLRRTWLETPRTPRRRFARLTCKFARTRRCYHTKKPVPTCVNTGLTCMLCGARTCAPCTRMLCGARTCAPRTRAPRPLPAFTRSARRRPWRRAQRTVVPAQERSRQRPEPHGRCDRPRQDGFHRRSEALQ